jgi:hypothetical protein
VPHTTLRRLPRVIHCTFRVKGNRSAYGHDAFGDCGEDCTSPPHRCASQPLRPSDLPHILNPASVEQIGQMDDERALVPSNLNNRRMIASKDLSMATPRSYL